MSTTNLNIRVTPDLKQRFSERCAEHGREWYDVVREFMEAYTDGRVTITPTEAQLKAMKETYNVN